MKLALEESVAWEEDRQVRGVETLVDVATNVVSQGTRRRPDL